MYGKFKINLGLRIQNKNSAWVLMRLCRSLYSENPLKGVVQVGLQQEVTETITPGFPRPWTEIPGPKRFPMIGSTLSLMTHKEFNPLHFDKFWRSLFEEFGPIVRIDPLLRGPTIVAVWKPEDIEAVYRSTAGNPVRVCFTSLRKVRYEAVNNYFNKKAGILVENDEEWKRVRSRVQTPMMKPQNMIQYLPQMDQVSLDFLDRIQDLGSQHGEMPANFLGEIYKWALESVGLVALNQRLGCLDKNLAPDSLPMQLIRITNEMMDALCQTEMNIKFWEIFPTPSFRRLKKLHDRLVQIADKTIMETEHRLRVNPSPDNKLTLMETLLQTPGLEQKDVVTMVLDMLAAGIDTTSHTLGFLLYLLAKNPRAQERLQKEVDQVIEDPKEHLTESHLARLSYLKACLKESHRLFPIILGTVRTLQEDITLSGYNVPKGWAIFLVNGLTSEKESLFPRAKEFLPERWGRDKPLGPIHPYASLPFSHGPRMCTGRRIAEQEIYVFLARLMQRYTVRYHYDDMKLLTRFVSLPSEPLKFEFIQRKKTK